MSEIGALEALLFAYGHEGVSFEDLEKALNLSPEDLRKLIKEYQETFENQNRGIKLVQYGGVYKLVTKKDYHDLIAKTMNFKTKRNLSQAALETLAIIAYKQPITRLEIEEIRGVNSDMMVRRLEAMDLIRACGRADSIGRPILYEVTDAFLDVFQLTSLDELPEIKIEMMDDKRDLFE